MLLNGIFMFYYRHNEDYMRKGMADYMHCNRLPELWKTIDQLHLSYLQTDESLDKIEQRTKLEGNFSYFILQFHITTRPL